MTRHHCLAIDAKPLLIEVLQGSVSRHASSSAFICSRKSLSGVEGDAVGVGGKHVAREDDLPRQVGIDPVGQHRGVIDDSVKASLSESGQRAVDIADRLDGKKLASMR